MAHLQAKLLLQKQLAELSKNPVEGFSAGLVDDNDIFKWEVLIIGPSDTLYEGGFFKCHLEFPQEYPLRPPKLKIITDIWHPNIERNGDVCISILHEPGDDRWGYEKASERWLPVHTVETILVSVISMLADPNDESPANVDAAKEWRENYPEFKRKVAKCVRKSQEELLWTPSDIWCLPPQKNTTQTKHQHSPHHTTLTRPHTLANIRILRHFSVTCHILFQIGC